MKLCLDLKEMKYKHRECTLKIKGISYQALSIEIVVDQFNMPTVYSTEKSILRTDHADVSSLFVEIYL